MLATVGKMLNRGYRDELPAVAILAGGLATRLRPLSEDIPKSLIPINGQPFIAYQLNLLRDSGITRAVVCVGFRGDQIADYLGSGEKFGIDIRLSSESPRLLGTGGAIKRALPLLGPRFFVIYGDSYLRCDYRAVFQAFRDSGRLALMTVFRNNDMWDASNVEYSNGCIRSYSKSRRSPTMRHIDYGLGVFDHSAFAHVPPEAPTDLAAVYEELLRRQQLAGYEVNERFYEIGSWHGIEELLALLRQREQA